MKNLVEIVFAEKAKQIKRFPCNSNRASMLGYFIPEIGGCLRRGVYERTNWQEKELHDVNLQLVFDDGRLHEEAVIKLLKESGIPIVEQQTMYSWPEYQITGHIDGKIIDEGKAYPIEIKSMAPSSFDSVNTAADFFNLKKPWFVAYPVQLTLYLLMQGVEEGIFLLKNKSTGALKQINYTIDYTLGEQALKAAEAINSHIANKTLPEQIDDKFKCKECPFKTLCLPDMQWSEPLKIWDDPKFEEKIDEYFSLKEAAARSEEVYKVITDMIKATCNGNPENKFLVGKYVIVAKYDSRGHIRIKIANINESNQLSIE